MVPIHIKIKWKSAENSAPGCNSLFDISVSSFTMTHIEKWTVWQTYSGISFFFFHFLFKSVIYILAEIPTSFFSSEVSHLHTRCISSLVSARLKDWHTGPTFELQLKVNNCRVWLNILFMHGGGGDMPDSVCRHSIWAPSLVEYSSSDLATCLLGFPGTCLSNPDGWWRVTDSLHTTPCESTDTVYELSGMGDKRDTQWN